MRPGELLNLLALPPPLGGARAASQRGGPYDAGKRRRERASRGLWLPRTRAPGLCSAASGFRGTTLRPRARCLRGGQRAGARAGKPAPEEPERADALLVRRRRALLRGGSRARGESCPGTPRSRWGARTSGALSSLLGMGGEDGDRAAAPKQHHPGPRWEGSPLFYLVVQRGGGRTPLSHISPTEAAAAETLPSSAPA